MIFELIRNNQLHIQKLISYTSKILFGKETCKFGSSITFGTRMQRVCIVCITGGKSGIEGTRHARTPAQACAGYRSPYPYPTSGIGVRTRTRTRSGTGTIVCTRTRIPEIPDLPENFKNSKNIDKIKFCRKNSSSKVQQSTFRKPIVFCLRK